MRTTRYACASNRTGKKVDSTEINEGINVGHSFQGDNGSIIHLQRTEEDLQLLDEFAVWEAASDADWLKLEKSL